VPAARADEAVRRLLDEGCAGAAQIGALTPWSGDEGTPRIVVL
jgi:hypothetical protein